jgi:hypothetical protein
VQSLPFGLAMRLIAISLKDMTRRETHMAGLANIARETNLGKEKPFHHLPLEQIFA